ncbi:hypothetical protein VNO80_00464 [Phaseolus coccineus]|uniref:Uncharacterized protein n=1 Tax=Phaseolus coccineus TaxID=3886 RepID=A0AAN9P3Z5_PHACN
MFFKVRRGKRLYLGIAHFRYFGGRGLDGGDDGVGINIEDTDEAVEGRGGDEGAYGVGSDGGDDKAVASVNAVQKEVVGVSEPKVSSRKLVRRSGGRLAGHTEPSCAFSTDLIADVR